VVNPNSSSNSPIAVLRMQRQQPLDEPRFLLARQVPATRTMMLALPTRMLVLIPVTVPVTVPTS
jgi:hypothetical protein